MLDSNFDSVMLLTLRYNSLVVVGVNTHAVTLEVKGVLTELGMAKLVLVEVRPTPYPSIDHMREPFATCHLQRILSLSIS